MLHHTHPSFQTPTPLRELRCLVLYTHLSYQKTKKKPQMTAQCDMYWNTADTLSSPHSCRSSRSWIPLSPSFAK